LSVVKLIDACYWTEIVLFGTEVFLRALKKMQSMSLLRWKDS